MPQILYVNPASLKEKRTMAKKRRTAAQRAATRKMIAANRARSGRRATPKRRRAKRKANPVTPLRARRAPTRRRARRAASRVRRRRNPSMPGFAKGFLADLMPAAVGGVGALALDVGMAMAPLPDAVKTGPLRPLVRLAGALGIGALAGMVASKRVGHQVAAGALTVVMYDTIKGFAAKFAGGKVPGIGLYDIPGIGMYEVSPAELPAPGMGYAESALQVGNGVAEYVGDYVDG